MANEIVTLESIAAQLAGLRDEAAVVRVDVFRQLGALTSSLFRHETESHTIKAAIGRVEHSIGALSGQDQPAVDYAAIRHELDELMEQFATIGKRLEQLEAQLERRP
jgi:chromosome segregation ATPase